MMKHHALSASNEIYIQGLLMQFLALLVEDAGCTVSPQQNTSSVYINQAISYIHKNYQNPLTVQEIADYLSLNRSYLTELFLKTVQLSPQQFLTRYRITKSEELLQSSSLSIQNIACSCGYSNSFSFSKAFRKVNGLSPSEYRKQKKSCRSSIYATSTGFFIFPLLSTDKDGTGNLHSLRYTAPDFVRTPRLIRSVRPASAHLRTMPFPYSKSDTEASDPVPAV